MAEINQSSELVTSRQHGVIGPMQLKIVSNLDVGSPLQPSVVRENGATPPSKRLVLRELENCSVNSSYNDGDKGSLEGHIAKLVDEIEIKVQSANEIAENNNNELKILKKQTDSVLNQLGVIASMQQLHFKTLLSVKSLRELRLMQTYLINQENNYSECQRVYNSVYKEITDLISNSSNETQKNLLLRF